MAKADDNIVEFERGEHPSDGSITCDAYVAGAGHTIRKGAVVFWKLSSIEHDEWRAACRKHALEEASQVY
jgi:hypothetical protein